MISVVTVCRNSAATIARTLASVAAQKGVTCEHVIIDGASTDETVAVVKSVSRHRVTLISEPDSGLYDAMNKGLKHATGEMVGFLNSDDIYVDDEVLADVARLLDQSGADFVYGDLVMVDRDGVVRRHWISGDLPPYGLGRNQLPHPALFIRRDVLKKINPPFDPTYAIAADLKQQLILTSQMRARGAYLRRPLVRMTLGGESTRNLKSYLRGWRESTRAYNEVFGHGGIWFTIRKVLAKLSGVRPKSTKSRPE